MNRRDFLKCIGGCAAGAVWTGAAGAASKPTNRQRPNIVFFMIDDMGWRDVGFMGSTYYETPHIDRLASEGMRFTDGYAACAVCSPTRAAVQTGRYPARPAGSALAAFSGSCCSSNDCAISAPIAQRVTNVIL